VLKSSSQIVEAIYEVPYLDHTVMEPFNCTAQVTPDRVEIMGRVPRIQKWRRWTRRK